MTTLADLERRARMWAVSDRAADKLCTELDRATEALAADPVHWQKATAYSAAHAAFRVACRVADDTLDHLKEAAHAVLDAPVSQASTPQPPHAYACTECDATFETRSDAIVHSRLRLGHGFRSLQVVAGDVDKSIIDTLASTAFTKSSDGTAAFEATIASATDPTTAAIAGQAHDRGQLHAEIVRLRDLLDKACNLVEMASSVKGMEGFADKAANLRMAAVRDIMIVASPMVVSVRSEDGGMVRVYVKGSGPMQAPVYACPQSGRVVLEPVCPEHKVVCVEIGRNADKVST